ncbi:oligosaccharide flippase family protein [Methylomonas methanica]|nr:oligosaccharide flippase family protein [Methylomonas methanica]
MSYQKAATMGMIWLAIGTIVSKVASFLSLIVLGWYLSSDEFALYALAYSSASIFIAIRNGGIQQILIQRGAKSFSKLNGYFFKYSLWFNFVGMALLISFTTVISKIYENDKLIEIISIIALSLPLSSFSMLCRAKLSIDHEFSKLAKLDSYSTLLRHGSASIFAIFGFGVYSFVIPFILSSALEIALGYYFSNKFYISKLKLTKRKFFSIYSSAKWLILASLATAFVLQGDYLVIGYFEDKLIVGMYFFGFQLTMAIAVVINSGLQSVIMPIFSKLNTDKKRQINAFQKSFRIYSLLVVLITGVFVVTAEPLIHFLWKGKWDQAIYVTQVISFSMMTRLLIPLARSLLEARKEWKMTFKLLLVDAIGILLSASVGVYLGGLIEISLAVSIYRFLFGFFYVYMAAKKIDMRLSPLLLPFTKVFAVAIIAIVYVFYFFKNIILIDFEIYEAIYLGGAYLIVLVSMLWVFQKSILLEFFEYSKRLVA